MTNCFACSEEYYGEFLGDKFEALFFWERLTTNFPPPKATANFLLKDSKLHHQELLGPLSHKLREGKAHQLFQHMLSALPPPTTPSLGPQKKVDLSHFLGTDTKRDPHELFGVDPRAEQGAPSRRFWATQSLVYCSFLPLKVTLTSPAGSLF